MVEISGAQDAKDLLSRASIRNYCYHRAHGGTDRLTDSKMLRGTIEYVWIDL
jgi:hypothetical protein